MANIPNIPNIRGPRRTLYSLRKDAIEPHLEERYMRRVEQLERWRIEHEQNLAREEKLANISKLEYQEVDYTPLLERKLFKERPFPNYNYLIEEASSLVSNRYILPITIRILMLVVIAIMMLVSFNTVTLWLSVTLGSAVSISLYFTLQDRQIAFAKAIELAKTTIQERITEHKRQQDEAKRAFEAQEQQRIDLIKNLMVGESSSIILKLDEVWQNLKFPFPVKLQLDLYHNTPLVTIYLPHKDIIPKQSSSLQQGARIVYKDKEQTEINKQFAELCAALFIRIIGICYEVVPSFDIGYAKSIMKDGLQDICVISASFDRNKISESCMAPTGIAALNVLNANYHCDRFGWLQQVQEVQPDGWGKLDIKEIRSLSVAIDT